PPGSSQRPVCGASSIGRNTPCPFGSRYKYKRCCGAVCLPVPTGGRRPGRDPCGRPCAADGIPHAVRVGGPPTGIPTPISRTRGCDEGHRLVCQPHHPLQHACSIGGGDPAASSLTAACPPKRLCCASEEGRKYESRVE